MADSTVFSGGIAASRRSPEPHRATSGGRGRCDGCHREHWLARPQLVTCNTGMNMWMVRMYAASEYSQRGATLLLGGFYLAEARSGAQAQRSPSGYPLTVRMPERTWHNVVTAQKQIRTTRTKSGT